MSVAGHRSARVGLGKATLHSQPARSRRHGLVRIPAGAYGAGRTNWLATGGGKPSAEVRIPLMDGLPIEDPAKLVRQVGKAKSCTS